MVRCQVLLAFSQSVADLPVDECEGPMPASQRACYAGPCNGEVPDFHPEDTDGLFGGLQDFDELYDWEYEGFTKCSESCGGGKKGALWFRSPLPSCPFSQSPLPACTVSLDCLLAKNDKSEGKAS